MNFRFFEKLSPDHAKVFLNCFLENAECQFPSMLAQSSNEGIYTDFSTESISPLMRWVFGKLKTLPKAHDMTVPKWIRDTDSCRNNLFDFEEESKPQMLLVAFYVGESFVRSYERLTWAIGNRDQAQANMPVIVGFNHGLEMAPILVAENLFGRIMAAPGKLSDIDRAITYWTQKAS